MYKDLRIRNANRCTPVPPSYKAYVFSTQCADTMAYKVILAPTLVIAWQRLKEFQIENDLDLFWLFVAEDDFEVCFSNNLMPK